MKFSTIAISCLIASVDAARLMHRETALENDTETTKISAEEASEIKSKLQAIEKDLDQADFDFGELAKRGHNIFDNVMDRLGM